MDENNRQIQAQGSVCSDSNGEDTGKNDDAIVPDRRICLVGSLARDYRLHTIAELFNVPVVTSSNGLEYVDDTTCSTYYIIDNFQGEIFSGLCKSRQTILGPPALEQLALEKKKELPDNTRPLYNVAMRGVVVCFTGFRNKDELTKLVPLIHHMGGSIRKDMTAKVTHLIANSCGGEKYQYASTFKVPVLNLQWVHDSWNRHRNDVNFTASQDSFMNQYKLKPFHGARVCFLGFSDDEEKHMTEVLLANGGTVTTIDDPNCTHVVTENSEIYTVVDPATTAPLSPRPDQSLLQSCPNLKTPNNNSVIDLMCLETLQEVSKNDDLVSEMDSICFEDTRVLDCSTASTKRKRKFASPECSSVKRKKDKCYSEKRKKVSSFFKTPINYFSNRRRTIDAATFNRSLNESVVSSSGVFNVETIDNLSVCLNPDGDTPRSSTRKSKKNLFTRTFSSSRFTRSKSKKLLMEVEAHQLNASCFPDISLSVPRSSLAGGSEVTLQQSSRVAAGVNVAVVDESQVGERPDVTSHRAHIVKAEWFWISVQKECSQEEKEYLFEDYIEQVASPGVRRESHAATPSSASRRKRKRMMVHETIQSLVQQTQSPALHKRRSSVSDAGLLSVSNSFLDCTASPVDKNAAFTTDGSELSIEPPPKSKSSRHLVFLELVDTETNYVGILHTIMTLFKDHLETMPEEEALLNNTELNLIFGKLPPIYEVHMKMLDELRWLRAHWTEELCTGDVITKYSTELQKAYPPFINFFEEAKAVLQRCDATKPRFHAFLKAMQTRPECGKLDLSDLMCSPSMRLGKVNILLKEILKYTPKTNPDHVALEKALESLKEVCTYINEDKRKADGQMTLFNIFNEIDNCPPDLVSSLRHYVIKADVIQLSSSEGLASKGSGLVLYVFSDRVEVCKKKSKVFNSAKSPASGIKPNNVKPYKHVRMVPLNTIKRVIDIKETEDCQNVFSLVCKSNEETKEKLYSFAFIVPDESESSTKPLTKVGFLKALTRAMADNLCSADAEKFMAYLEPQQLDIDTSDLSNGTLSKAFKFAKTRLKVGRTFSFNKSTPSKLKRAVSSMMSPFGSSTNLTPASQLANMRLASYSNINELGSQTENSDESPPVAPMSVQPTRKVKASSLGVNALKRL
ncbi:protein ECT2 isoform X2 [Anthonomus grandis grandis]|uniref:protein ECT2 isoform X2 n=1 Tax=Anthonomus grandis grandis TaxID=2921223 RepID=UPI002164FC0B|nr:protein ECT2 isoform X2 [Anthonomus grandis grandis]